MKLSPPTKIMDTKGMIGGLLYFKKEKRPLGSVDKPRFQSENVALLCRESIEQVQWVFMRFGQLVFIVFIFQAKKYFPPLPCIQDHPALELSCAHHAEMLF